MQSNVKIIVRYIILLAFLLCFGTILADGGKLMKQGAPVIYYRNKEPVSLQSVKEMRAEDADAQIHIPFTACGSMESQSFVNPDLGKSVECPLLFISGDSTLMTPSFPGQLFEDDKYACLLSTQAAWELFGEPAVGEGLVEYGEEQYQVRGVFEFDEPFVILPAAALNTPSSGTVPDEGDDPEENEASSFDRLIIKPSIGAKREEIVQIFENRNGGSADKADCMTYRRLAGIFLSFLPLMILVITLYRCLTFLFRNRYKPFYAVAGIAGFAAFGRLFFLITSIEPSIPPDLIPSRWSDFDFWGKKIESFRLSIAHMLFIGKSELELSFFEPLTGIAALTLAGAVLFCICVAVGKLRNRKWFLCELAASAAISLLAFFLLRDKLDSFKDIRQVLLLWPYYLAGKYLFIKSADGGERKETVNEQTAETETIA